MECLKPQVPCHQRWSASGPMLFSLFLCDMFFLVDNKDIACYADDNTPYNVGKSQRELERKLQRASVNQEK